MSEGPPVSAPHGRSGELIGTCARKLHSPKTSQQVQAPSLQCVRRTLFYWHFLPPGPRLGTIQGSTSRENPHASRGGGVGGGGGGGALTQRAQKLPDKGPGDLLRQRGGTLG